MTKLSLVQFVNVVSFGGQLQSASLRPVGDRPGQGTMEILADLDKGLVYLTKNVNGRPVTKLVPMSNIASFELLEAPKAESSKK